MTVHLVGGASRELLSSFNHSTRYQFNASDEHAAIDLQLIDTRSTDTCPTRPHCPTVAVASGHSQCFEHLQALTAADASLIEFVNEDELGTDLLDARLYRLLASANHLAAQRRAADRDRITLESVMTYSNDWMVIKSLEHRFLHVSKKFCHANGSTPEEIIGKNDLEIGTSPELVLGKPGTEWKGFWALDDEVVEKGEHTVLQPVVMEEDDRQETRESTDKVPLRDSCGEVFALLVCVSALTQKKRVDRAPRQLSSEELKSLRFWEQKSNLEHSPALTELNEARKHAEERLNESDRAFVAKNQFIASASHDLRQPLHALGLYLRALEKKVDADDAFLVEKIKHCATSLNELLNSLLDISRLDANVVSAQLSSFCVDDLLCSLRDECDSIARGKSLDIACSTDSSQVYSDPILLRRVIRNLLINAIKYTEEGRITLSAVRVGSHVKVVVADTGVGIPEEKHRLVFEEFAKLDAHAQHSSHFQQGLGLGLSIVKRLCRLLDITIELHSTVGKGTRVNMMVPLGQSMSLSRSASAHSAEPRPAHEVIPNSNSSSPVEKLILVIDDEKQVCEAVETVLIDSGYRVITAQSVDDAVQKVTAAAEIPDATLVDFRLSEHTTGLDAIDILGDLLGASIPSLVVTGDTSGDGLKEITDSGHKHLHKPVDVDELLDIVREIVS